MLKGMVQYKDITARSAFRLVFMYICDRYPDKASQLKDKCLDRLGFDPTNFFAGYMTALCDEVVERQTKQEATP